MSVLVSIGDDALGRLGDASFAEEWARLHATCAWATAFQSFAFVDGWYRLHEPHYEPLIVEGRDANRRLVGLLTLARRRPDQSLVGAGDFHAEYQTWIADEPSVGAFLWESLRQLERSYPRGRLRLMYVPATAPLGWTHGDSVWPRRIHLRSRPGGFIDLSDPARIEESLQKGHNRNRLNGLRRSGEVRLESIDTVEGLEREMDEIAVLCDLRQGAVNDSLPFTNNPLKRPLHIEMMERGLLRVTILRVGNEIGSAHLDVKDGDDVLLYLAAHAPRFARYSPGSLHILLLARQLATEGVRRFDLSPGGGYKDRYADHSENTHMLNVRFGLADRMRSDLAGRMEAGATSVLSAAGQTPRQARANLLGVRARAVARFKRHPAKAARHARSVVFELPDQADIGGGEPLALDRLADLLAYQADGPGQHSIHGFLRLALHRLESGHRVLTRLDGSRLVECWWVSRLERRTEGKGKAAGTDIASAPAVLLYDPVSLPTSGGPESRSGALARVRSTIRAIAPHATTFVAVSIDDQEGVDALSRVGAIVVTDASELTSPLRDLAERLASGWPDDHPGST